jgi:hypothetical protein
MTDKEEVNENASAVGRRRCRIAGDAGVDQSLRKNVSTRTGEKGRSWARVSGDFQHPHRWCGAGAGADLGGAGSGEPHDLPSNDLPGWLTLFVGLLADLDLNVASSSRPDAHRTHVAHDHQGDIRRQRPISPGLALSCSTVPADGARIRVFSSSASAMRTSVQAA